MVRSNSFWLVRAANAQGSVISFQFSGSVTFASPLLKPYGVTIANGAAVSGQFQYDSATTAWSGSTADAAVYQQQIAGGFSATFGGVPVATSSYMIKVSNDVSQPGGSLADIVGIRFSSSDVPAPSAPLNFNGTDQSVGLFSITLVGPSTLFSQAQLPGSLSFGDFTSNSSFLSDSPAAVDVIFTLNNLVQVPEPSAGVLIVTAMSILIPTLYLRRSSHATQVA